jgi:hypothetical protein
MTDGYSSFSKAIKSSIKKKITTKQVTIFCFLIALLNKILIAFLLTSLEGDKSLYLLFSQSLLDGHGLTEKINLLSQKAPVYSYNPAVISPLYSLLAAPVLWLTGSFFITSLVIDIVAWIVFFSGLYFVAKTILINQFYVNLFILATGFFIYPQQLASTPKDTLAIGLILWSCHLCYK